MNLKMNKVFEVTEILELKEVKSFGEKSGHIPLKGEYVGKKVIIGILK